MNKKAINQRVQEDLMGGDKMPTSEQIINSLNAENTLLRNQLQELSNKYQQAIMVNTFKRLDYLFKVVENNATFTALGHKDIVNESIIEISELILPPKNQEDIEDNIEGDI